MLGARQGVLEKAAERKVKQRPLAEAEAVAMNE